MTPLEAIEADPPNVWLTYFDGFAPERWGQLGFTQPGDLTAFLNRTKPGVLVVLIGSNRADAKERHRIIGIQQCSHERGTSDDFLHPDALAEKNAGPDKNKWNLAVRCVRAWRVLPHSRIPEREMALETWSPKRARYIGKAGMLLTEAEARRVLDLDVEEVSVYGQDPIAHSEAGTARAVFTPSRAGPMSQCPFEVRASEGPKHLYVLKLSGPPGVFLNDASANGIIVKVGMTGDPERRCAEHNAALPMGRFRWSLLWSTASQGLDAFPSSKIAIAGENEMKTALATTGRSLGGEFFLAEEAAARAAFNKGIDAARKAHA